MRNQLSPEHASAGFDRHIALSRVRVRALWRTARRRINIGAIPELAIAAFDLPLRATSPA
jgi:hypothetical protein